MVDEPAQSFIMEKKEKDFHILKAINITTLFLTVLFLGLFTKVIISVMTIFQSEVYTDVIASIGSM